MAEQALLLNTSEYFKSSEFSDVTIVLVEDLAADGHAEGPAGKRRKLADGTAAPADAASTQNVVRLPGHKFLLCACSSVCKTQISRWTESSPHELELRVPTGQLHIGELMIKCMYEPNPDLSNCSQQQLLQLLMLSDQHDVPKAVYAASRTLSRISSKDFEWETVQAVYSLPPACPDMDAYKPLFAVVATRLQEELGDLDKCLQDQLLLPKLIALPHLGVLQLLKDDRTRVHSENTVVLVIRLWIGAQERAQVRRLQQQQLQEQQMQRAQGQAQESEQTGPAARQAVQQQSQQQVAEHPVPQPAAPAAGPSAAAAAPSAPAEVVEIAEEQECPPQQQIEQLVHLIRVQYCTQPYVATTMFAFSRFAKCFTESERMMACIYSGQGNGNSVQLQMLKKCGPALKYPAWNAAERPKSVIKDLSLEIALSLESVQALAEKCLGERKRAGIRLEGGRFQGRQIAVTLQAQYRHDAKPHPGCNIYICAGLEGMPESSLAAGALEVRVIPTPLNHPAADRVQRGNLRFNFRVSLRQKARSVTIDCCHFGLITDWLASERELRAKGLVHPDGCMHIVMTFWEPFL